MSQLTSRLCFCGAAPPFGGRRSALLERLCLEARFRVNIGEGAQALVLFQTIPAFGYAPLFRVGAFTVACVEACPQACLSANDVLTALSHGFDRVFIQLCSDPQLVKQQMALLDEVAAWRQDLQGRICFFNAEPALRVLMSDDRGAPDPLADVYVTVSQGCTLCGVCGWVCPSQAIQLGEGDVGLQITDDLCTGCGMCAMVCPQSVISLVPAITTVDKCGAAPPPDQPVPVSESFV